MAYTRSTGNIALGSASTALAATLYDDFETTHSLFKFPVVDEADKEPNEPTRCELHNNPQRMELLLETALFIFDEFPSLDREVFEAAYKALSGFENKIVICMGDFRQIAPVVPNGDRHATVDASIKSSPLWRLFTVLNLTIHMRLTGLRANIAFMTVAEIEDLRFQESFASMLDYIGNGAFPFATNENHEEGSQNIPLHFLKCLYTEQDALDFLYPQGFDSFMMTEKCILAATNVAVDTWNQKIQLLNPATPRQLFSRDRLCEVDDPNGFLASMLTEDILNKFNNAGVPPHELTLKENDICILLRNIDKSSGLTNNRRVIIKSITNFCIKVATTGHHPKYHYIPRIHFKFRLPFGQSFQLLRTQFPLRLAYSVSINKAQGQELAKVLCDFRVSPFSHGHTYVALSRVRHHSHIAVLTTTSQIIWKIHVFLMLYIESY